MAAKLLLFGIVFLSTWASTARSQSSGGGGDDALPCVKKLLPCSSYLKSPSPPPACCIPLKETISSDPGCLCDIFYNDNILKTFNVTQEEILKLPQNCGGNAPDLGLCKTNSSSDKPAPSTPTPPTPTPPTPDSPSKTPPKGPSSSSGGLGKRMTRATAILVAGGMLYLTLTF